MKAPEPQGYLNDTAKEYYYLICEHLDSAEALEDIDSFGLSQMAMDLWMFHEAANLIKKEGPVQITQNGYSQITGHFTVLEKCKASFLKYSQKFGLSPKDRELMKQFNVRKKAEDKLDKI